ncbi:AtaL-like protein [Teichococcus aerophilus]|uniref:AtaL-like protein n=1 Tax=Teichococcus aerophilus TaxID=1224513 RepID=UPI003463159E
MLPDAGDVEQPTTMLHRPCVPTVITLRRSPAGSSSNRSYKDRHHDLFHYNRHGEPGRRDRLTREQVWKGLELKARDARLFLSPGVSAPAAMSRRRVPPNFVRDAQATGPREGTIITSCSRMKTANCDLDSFANLGCATDSRTAPRNRPSNLSSAATQGTPLPGYRR